MKTFSLEKETTTILGEEDVEVTATAVGDTSGVVEDLKIVRKDTQEDITDQLSQKEINVIELELADELAIAHDDWASGPEE